MLTSSEPAIALDAISKSYRVRRPREIGSRFTRKVAYDSFHALDDVSFTVGHGELVGLVGANGAGKSTILKIISRVTKPDRGTLRLSGPIMSLLEVGAGFHPELTGRENVYLNGAILGLTRRQVASHFDDIVALSGVDQYLDTQVKRFSSGMRVRLAIAIGLHLDSDAVILDEVLSVGDAEFQRRCLQILDLEARQSGRATLLVSHNMQTVQQACRRVLVMDRGRLIFDGDVDHAIAQYLSHLPGAQSADLVDLTARSNEYGDGANHIVGVRLGETAGVRATITPFGPMVLSVLVDCQDLPTAITLDIHIKGLAGQLLASSNHAFDSRGEPSQQQRELVWRIPELALGPGRYSLGLEMRDQDTNEVIDLVSTALSFSVVDPAQDNGLEATAALGRVLLGGEWSESA